MYMCVNFKDEILFSGGESENPDKFENFHKTVNCLYSIGCKPGTSLDLG